MSMNDLISIVNRSQPRYIETGDQVCVGPHRGTVTGWQQQPDWTGIDWLIGVYISRLNRTIWRPVNELAFVAPGERRDIESAAA